MERYNNNEQLKRLLKAAWTKNGFTQKDIAEKMGVSSANLSNILVNKKSLTFADVQRILDALDCDLYIDFKQKE